MRKKNRKVDKIRNKSVLGLKLLSTKSLMPSRENWIYAEIYSHKGGLHLSISGFQKQVGCTSFILGHESKMRIHANT